MKTVVIEANKLGLEKKEADKDKAVKEEAAQKIATPTEKAVSAATTILTQVSSEADVTNTLAVTELRKKEVSEDNRVAIEAAVAKNQAVLNESKVLLADKSVTKEQVDAQLERLNESILAVYSELKKAGIGRDGKFEVALADVAERVDEAPLTEAEQADHWKKYADKNTERLKHQIKWFDITSKTAVVENLGDGGKLQVGTKFKQELTPGYVVEMEVTALKPFNSTDVYKERGGAGYDPNAQNVYKDGTPAEVKVVRQGGYSVAKTNGIDTGGTTVIQSVKNGANVGVEFKVKATLNGKEVPANVVFATGEEAGSSEIEIYKTDGDGFELVTELSNTNYRVPTARSYTAESYDNRYNLTPVGGGQGRQLGQSYSIEGSGKPAFAPFIADKAKGFRSTEITEETVSTVTDKDGTVYSDGLGTQVFGPAVTHRDSGMSTPVVLTRNAKNLGVYILSSGQQGAMFGFMVLDEGDAPASYGKVGHAIAKGAGITQPYLGSKEPDVDIRTEKITDETAFKYDDVNGEGEDEGARQLMGDKVAQGDNYKLKKVNAGTYSMTFDAHLGGGKNAFVNGWIDFNNNGKFDENEGAGAVEVTKDGEVTLTWTTPVQNVDVTATKLATRLRIANDKADVKEATGIAYSGEVEDFQIQQTIPPRGTKEETYDIQGATQRSTIKFNAYGNKDYNFEEKAAIDETVQPQIVKADGSVVTEAELVDGYYVVPGQGKYKVTAKGKDVNVEFVPEATFVGDADGITIRRTDTNGATTGWGKIGKPIVNGEGENGDQLTLISDQVTPEGATEKGSMDGRYIPHVMKREIVDGKEKSNDIQGAKQTRTPEFKDTADNKINPSEEFPAKLVDPKTGKPTDETEIPATKDGKPIGTYTITPSTGEVVFTPNKDFTGDPDPVKVSFTGKVGVDKDGNPVTSTGTVTYQPTVKPVTPTAEEATSIKPQGQVQKGTVTFTAGSEVTPIVTTKTTLLDENNQPAEEVDAKSPEGKVIGKYTLNKDTGEVTFTPDPTVSYAGDVVPVTVRGEDTNGSQVTTTYTPSIIPVNPSANPAKSEGPQGVEQTGTVEFIPGNSNKEPESPAPINKSTITLLDKSGNPAETVTVTKDGKEIGVYSLVKDENGVPTGEVKFTPTDKTYVGEVEPVTVQAKDTNSTVAKTTYTPKFTGVTPTGTPVESTGIQGKTQEGTPKFTEGDVKVPIKIDETQPATFYNPVTKEPIAETEIPATKDGKEVGKYKIDPKTGTVTFTPNKDFTGTPDPVTVQAKDANGTPTTATYTPTVTPVTPTAEGDKSTGLQGKVQTGTPKFTPGNPEVPMDDEVPATFEDGQTTKTIDKVGTYTVAKDGTVTFTPDKSFTGEAPAVTVKRVDKNGTPATATYTPTVTGVTPTGTPAESTGIQGKTQEGTPTFTPGNSEVPITITDEQPAQFVVDGSPVTEKEIPAKDKDGKEVGKYTIDPKSGKVTFTPNKDFTGTPDPATVQVKDANGTPTTATYTPTVTGVTPTGTPAESTGIQGKTQEGTPTFTPGNSEVPITITDEQPAQFVVDGSPVTEKEIPAKDKDGKEVGKYTIDPKSGKVTFTPNKDFTGTPDPATVQVKDANGTPTTATYTPTVTPVTPTAEGDKSTGLQGKVQTGTPKFTPGNPEVPMDDEVPATFEDGQTTKTIDKVGTYTVAKDGTVTFTPDKSFTGEAPAVTVKRVDKNGTPATATYTPTVTGVTPTAEGDKSTGLQGKVQTGTPKFTPGNPEVPMDDEVPATFEDGQTTKTIDKVGTYTVAKDGTVTFTPDKSFTGEAPAVTVKRVDKNGTPATATYTPTVTPVTPTAEGVTSEGAKGQVQTGKPTFKEGNSEVPMDDEVPATFEDGSTVKTVEGIGKYEVAKDGTVTFTPEKSFTGKAPAVTVKRVDKNGTPATATYTPTVRPDTKFVVVGKDGKETELIPSKDGKQPEEKIAGYKVVKTETDEKGNTKHIYEKVTTSFKDKEGNEIPGYPTEEGTTPKKDNIPGYRFVETKKLPNGDVEHVYEKVKTSFKDKEGNEIPNYPTEDGDQPKKDIPGYRFVETKKLPNGDIEHIYEKVVTPTPKYVEGQKELPNTGTEANASLAALGLLGALSGFGLLARKKKED